MKLNTSYSILFSNITIVGIVNFDLCIIYLSILFKLSQNNHVLWSSLLLHYFLLLLEKLLKPVPLDGSRTVVGPLKAETEKSALPRAEGVHAVQ